MHNRTAEITSPYNSKDTLLVYGDESGNPGDPIFGIGLLLVPLRIQQKVLDVIQEKRKEMKYPFSIHYSELKKSSARFAKAIINIFCAEPLLQFRASIYPGAAFRLHEEQPHHVVSPSEFLYDTAYAGTVANSIPRIVKKVIVYPHEKDKRRPDRFIDSVKKANSKIVEIQELTAKNELIRMSDMLLGCACGHLRGLAKSEPKVGIQNHLRKKLGIETFYDQSKTTEYKFRLWFKQKP